MPNLFSWLWQPFQRADSASSSEGSGGGEPEEAALQAGLRLTRERLAPLAAAHASAAAASRALGRLDKRLSRPLRVALLGEFNTGKSSLARLLLGSAMPAPGVLPETTVPVLFRYAERPELFLVSSNGERRAIVAGTVPPGLGGESITLVEAALPLRLLRRVEILDVPGTANPASGTSEVPAHIVRDTHFALWCTPATQAWKGSEQRAWLALPRRLRPASLLVATHMDLLREHTDREKVMNRLRRETRGYFRDVAMISTTQRAMSIEQSAAEREEARRQGASTDLWYANGGRAFWSCLMDAVAAARAAREDSAARVARRIAAWTAARLAPPQDGNQRAVILDLWRKQAETLARAFAGNPASDEAALAGFADELSRFASNALKPGLEPYLGWEAANAIAMLFCCDPRALAKALGGRSGDATAQRLRGVLAQLSEELAEALDAAHSQLAAPRNGSPELRHVFHGLLQPETAT